MGYTGPVQMGYGARTFSTHTDNGTFFYKTYIRGKYFLRLFL